MNITVLGAGAWGTALAISLAARHTVTLWGRDGAQMGVMARTRRNQDYLPDVELPASLSLTHELDHALAGAELALVVVPVSALRATLQRLASLLPAPVPVIWACKGFEQGSALLPHEVVMETLRRLERLP